MFEFLESLGISVLEKLRFPLTVAFVFAIAFVINHLARRYLNATIIRNAKVLKVDPTNYNFIRNAFSITIYALAFGYVLSQVPGFKKASQTLFTGAGIFAAIVAFASQQAFSNIFSGIFIIIFRPFRVDDIIEIAPDKRGIVEDITLRHTIIRNFESKRIIVPNSVINNTVIVNSDIKEEEVRRHIDIPLSYEAPVERAIEIIAEEARQHPFYVDHRNEDDIAMGLADVEVRVLQLYETHIMLRAYVWAVDHLKGFRLSTDLNKAILKRFKEEGIPFAYPIHIQQLRLNGDFRLGQKAENHQGNEPDDHR